MPGRHEDHKAGYVALSHSIQLLAQKRVVGSALVSGHGVAGKTKQPVAGLLALGKFSPGCCAGLSAQVLQVLYPNTHPALYALRHSWTGQTVWGADKVQPPWRHQTDGLLWCHHPA